MKTIELKLDLRGICFVSGDKITLVYMKEFAENEKDVQDVVRKVQTDIELLKVKGTSALKKRLQHSSND
jgi:hypothetical protein